MLVLIEHIHVWNLKIGTLNSTQCQWLCHWSLSDIDEFVWNTIDQGAFTYVICTKTPDLRIKNVTYAYYNFSRYMVTIWISMENKLKHWNVYNERSDHVIYM